MTITSAMLQKKNWFFSWVIPKANHIFSTVESSFVNKKKSKKIYHLSLYYDFDQFFQIIPFLFMINSIFSSRNYFEYRKRKICTIWIYFQKTF